MGKVYWLSCPQCGFAYYIGQELLDVPDVPTHCPKCHFEYAPSESATGIRETS